mgnify:CR=1 FL=1
MAFQVEITPIAEAQIEQAYRWYRELNPEFADRWFRGLMNAIATLQEVHSSLKTLSSSSKNQPQRARKWANGCRNR